MADRQQIKEEVETAATAAAEVSWFQTRAILRVILIVLTVAALIWILKALTGIIVLIVLSVFFAYLVAPLVAFVRRPFRLLGREHTMPLGLAIAGVYVIIFGALGLALYFLLPRLGAQITQFGEQVPAYLDSAKALSERFDRFYDSLRLPAAVRDTANRNFSNMLERVGAYLTGGLENVLLESLHYLPWLILIPILAFFLLKDAATFRRSALQMLPRGRWRWRGDEFFQEVNSTLAAYIRAQLTASVFIGFVCTIGFYAIGLPYALLLGIIAGVLEFIPLVGPLTVAVLATSIAAFYSIKQAVVVVLFLGILRIAHDYVTYPRIIRQGLHLHPLAVILAILSGAELAGITGIFLAIPVVAIVSVSYRHWLEHRGSEGLVADLLRPSEPSVAAVSLSEKSPKKITDSSAHPTIETSAEESSPIRPDLKTGELKTP